MRQLSNKFVSMSEALESCSVSGHELRPENHMHHSPEQVSLQPQARLPALPQQQV